MMDIKYLGFVIVGIISLFAGCHTLDGELVSDDFVLMEAAERVGVIEMFTANWLGERGTGGFYRPMVLAAWKIDHLLHGRHPKGYHVTNLILHMACALMAYLLILKFCGTVRIALPAAALFAVHPIHVEAIAWISGRTDTVAAAFYLFSMLCFLGCSRNDTPRPGSGVLALVSGICAMLSKEIAYTLPFTLCAMRWLLPPASGYRRRSCAPYFIALAAIMAVRFWALGGLLGGYGAGKHLRFDGVIFNYITFYIQWFIEPFQLAGPTRSVPWIILLSTFIVLSILALASQKSRPGMIWFWITILPVLNICRAQYVYLPSIGLFWAVAALVFGDTDRDEPLPNDLIRAGVWISLLLIFGHHTIVKNRQWSQTGWTGKGVESVFRAVQPAVPSKSRFVVINPPVNAQLNVGVFQNGLSEAVRLWYDDPFLDAVRIHQIDQFRDFQAGKDIVWLFEDGRIADVTDRYQRSGMTRVPWPGFDAPGGFPDVADIMLATPDAMFDGMVVDSQLANADALPDGIPVAGIELEFADGRRETHRIMTGEHTSEWAFDREDVRARVRHRRAPVAYSYISGAYPEKPVPGHTYRAVFMFEKPDRLVRAMIRPVPEVFGKNSGGPEPVQTIQLEIRQVSGIIVSPDSPESTGSPETQPDSLNR